MKDSPAKGPQRAWHGIPRPWLSQRSLLAGLTQGDGLESGRFPLGPTARGGRDRLEVGHASDRARLRSRPIKDALLALAAQPTAGALQRFYRLLTAWPQLGVVGEVEQPDGIAALLADPRVLEIGRLLAREAPCLAAVSFGILLLSASDAAEDLALLQALAADSHLTPCVAEAWANRGAEGPLFALAQVAEGVAKIRTVEWLTETQSPDIRAWLLRDGACTLELTEHLAYLCITTGGLHEALAVAHADDALLRGAGVLLAALASGLSAPTLEDYPEASAAIAAWLRHLRAGGREAEHLAALEALSACPELTLAEREECFMARFMSQSPTTSRR